MASYAKLHHAFWRDPEVGRWSEDERFIAIYLLTCPHRTSEGLFFLPIAYAARDLRYPIERVSKGYLGLTERGFLDVDADSETILLPNALKWERPRGPQQLKGAANRLAEVPPTPLFGRFLALCEAYCSDLLPYLATLGITAERYPLDTVSKGSRYPLDCSSSSSSSSSSSTSPSGEESEEGASRRSVARRLPERWQPNPSHHEKAGELKLDVEEQAELFRHHAAANDRRQKNWDSAFHMWLRKAVEYQRKDGTDRRSPATVSRRVQERMNYDAALQARIDELEGREPDA